MSQQPVPLDFLYLAQLVFFGFLYLLSTTTAMRDHYLNQYLDQKISFEKYVCHTLFYYVAALFGVIWQSPEQTTSS